MARTAWGTVGIAAALAAAWAPTRSGAQALDGQVLVSWRGYETDGVSSDGLNQRYDFSWRTALSEALGLRLLFRAESDDSGSTTLGQEQTLAYRELQPGVELTFTLPTLSAFAQWDEVRIDTELSGLPAPTERRLDRLQGGFSLAPEQWPSLGVGYYRTGARDEATGEELLDERATAQLEYLWRRLRLAALYQSSGFEDPRAGFVRDASSLQGEIGWGGSFARDRLTIQLDALTYSGRFEERPLAGASESLRPVVLAEAWQGIDDTPLDSSDRPLGANPRLRDGDLDSAAGASLGPQATPNLALAASFNRLAPVDELRIYVRDGSGNPVTTGGPVLWDLYSSLDGVTWIPILGAVSRYDPALGLYSVTFEEVAVRWLKVVTFFVNTVPTEVTELTAFDRRGLQPGTRPDTDLERQGASVSISVRPVESLTISWNALGDATLETSAGAADIETRDVYQSLTATWEPNRWANLLAQLQSSRSDRDQPPDTLEQDYDTALAIFEVSPNGNLVISAEVARTEAEFGSGPLETDRYFLRGFGRLWGTLDVTLDAGLTQQTAPETGLAYESPSGSAQVRAALTRSLQLTAGATYQRTELVSGEVGDAALRDSDLRWYLDLFWRPSSVLGLGVRAGEASGGGTSTPLQTYRIDWRPFPGGSLSLTALYDENVDPSLDRRSRRVLINPQWRLNPMLTLTLDYSFLQQSGTGIDSEIRTTFAGLIFNL